MNEQEALHILRPASTDENGVRLAYEQLFQDYVDRTHEEQALQTLNQLIIPAYDTLSNINVQQQLATRQYQTQTRSQQHSSKDTHTATELLPKTTTKYNLFWEACNYVAPGFEQRLNKTCIIASITGGIAGIIYGYDALQFLNNHDLLPMVDLERWRHFQLLYGAIGTIAGYTAAFLTGCGVLTNKVYQQYKISRSYEQNDTRDYPIRDV